MLQTELNGSSSTEVTEREAVHFCRFDNRSRRSFPESSSDTNCAEKFRGVVLVACEPEPLELPLQIWTSPTALALISERGSQEMNGHLIAEALAGRRAIAGSEPAAYCVCGHQFGSFAGIVGDGDALYLGEAVPPGKREHEAAWELQLRGAGRTPFSGPNADGRKALPAACAEFVMSEALYALGVPTARAVALVASETRVPRSLGAGNPVSMERACSLLCVAPSFLRFGNFEICRRREGSMARSGPSAELEGELLPTLLDFTIRTHFSHIWRKHKGEALSVAAAQGAGHIAKQDMYLDFFREVTSRTAVLCAAWQAVGFVHGLLNSEFVSVIGLTLCCEHSCFLEQYNPNFSPNPDDTSCRYSFRHQPEICRWNCEKLGEALSSCGLTPSARIKSELDFFWTEYLRNYYSIMRKKLGLLREEDADLTLVDNLLKVLKETGADYTNTFFSLREFNWKEQTFAEGTKNSAPSFHGAEFLERLLDSLPTPAEMASELSPRHSVESLQALLMLSREPKTLEAFGTNVHQLEAQLKEHKTAEELRKVAAEEKKAADRKAWLSWLAEYAARLERQTRSGVEGDERRTAMARVNPSYVPRKSSLRQAAAADSERGGGQIQEILARATNPFDDPPARARG